VIFLRNTSEGLCHPVTDISAIEDILLLENYFSVLNDKEKDIISLVYLRGYTFDEVANMYNVSRQMINICIKIIEEAQRVCKQYGVKMLENRYLYQSFV